MTEPRTLTLLVEEAKPIHTIKAGEQFISLDGTVYQEVGGEMLSFTVIERNSLLSCIRQISPEAAEVVARAEDTVFAIRHVDGWVFPFKKTRLVLRLK